MEIEEPPMWLHRFQKLNEDNLLALKQLKLWFSSVDRFNDPFEFFTDVKTHADSLVKSTEQELDLHGYVSAIGATVDSESIDSLLKSGTLEDKRLFLS